MKKFRLLVAVLTIAIMALAMTGCGNSVDQGSGATQTVVLGDTQFELSDAWVADKDEDMNKSFTNGDLTLITSLHEEEMGEADASYLAETYASSANKMTGMLPGTDEVVRDEFEQNGVKIYEIIYTSKDGTDKFKNSMIIINHDKEVLEMVIKMPDTDQAQEEFDKIIGTISVKK